MLYRKPRIGHEINAYCGKCKDERTHIVAAMDGETVRRVTCSMCGGNHLYRPKTSASKSSPRSSGSKRAAGTSRKTRQSVINLDPNDARAYDMNASFSAGDIINHPKFGLGSVEVEIAPNKIEVKFQEGKKLLLHNLKNSRH